MNLVLLLDGKDNYLYNMNLQEQIRRILREEVNKTERVNKVLNTLNLTQNERICGFEVIPPEKNTEKFYYNNKQNIPFKVKVYYIAGPASEYWPRKIGRAHV